MGKNYDSVLLEDMNAKIDAILEALVPMRQELTEVKKQTNEIPEIKSDIKVIKAAITDTNKQVHNHERRITALEAL